ncbi:nucleotidyltransferase family protein [Flavobacterium sp. RHBU_24]|uniref:nucleotidyltransferase family protein n=1 Tax=Flavobacterium sp. RHBU_24 TaxID=3391185 RepID=UPI0039855FBA
MNTLQEIQSVLVSHKQRLFREYPIKSLAIFGSYSRNEQKTDSDLDVLIEFSGKIGIRFIDLAEEIEVITGTKVDLVSKNAIKGKYLDAISTDLIYV